MARPLAPGLVARLIGVPQLPTVIAELCAAAVAAAAQLGTLGAAVSDHCIAGGRSEGGESNDLHQLAAQLLLVLSSRRREHVCVCVCESQCKQRAWTTFRGTGFQSSTPEPGIIPSSGTEQSAG